MIHRSDNSKTAAIFLGDHQAAASATPVIFAGIDAGHRTPTGDLVGSPCLRRSPVLSKPAHVAGEPMANCSAVPRGRYAAKFLGVKHEAVFEIGEGMQAGERVRLEFEYGEIAEKIGPSIHKLLTDRTATSAAKRLHDALARFLDDGDGGEAAADVIRHAAAVVHELNIFHADFGTDFGTDFATDCDCETD